MNKMTKKQKSMATGVFYRALLIAGIAGSIALAGCKKDPDDTTKTGGATSLDLTVKTLMFDDNGWETKTSEVVIKPQDATWEIASAPEWLTVEPQGETIAVTAHEYMNFRDRKGTIVVSSGDLTAEIEVTQTKSTPKIEQLPASGIPAKAVSRNGRYVVGTASARSFAYDRMTGDLYRLGSGGRGVNPPEMTIGVVVVDGVSNNGIVVGSASVNTNANDPNEIITKPFSFNVHTKEFVWLRLEGAEIAAVTPKTPITGHAWDISADGTSISGYIGLPANGEAVVLRYIPVVWKGDEIIVLNHDPEELELNDIVNGMQPTQISADGSVVAGYVVPRIPRNAGMFWNVAQPDVANYILRDDPTYFASEIYTVTNTGIPSKYLRPYKLSDDGKVITGTLEDFTISTERGTRIPMSYNIETGEVILATIAQGTDGSFSLPDGTIVSINDDGSIFYRDGNASTFGDWLSEHNIEPHPGFNLLRDASTSGKVMVGGSRSGGGFQPIVVSL